MDFQCQREPSNHVYCYIFRVEREAITKIGQSPSLASIASASTARFRSVLDKSFFQDLNRAIGLFAHGVGAGSFVYLRRIFEHLLYEAAFRARKEGELLEGFETMRMEDKIAALKSYLPEEIFETAGTYSLLSAGIHAMTEDNCLSLFPVMQASIEIILDGHLAMKEKERHKADLKRALSKATSEAKQSKTQKK